MIKNESYKLLYEALLYNGLLFTIYYFKGLNFKSYT